MGKLNKFWFAGGFAAAASLASADVFWTGASATNNWSNAFNWFGFDRPDNDWSDWVCFDSSGVRSSPNVNESYNIKGILFDNFYGSAVQYSIVGTGTLGMTLGIENLMSSAQGSSRPSASTEMPRSGTTTTALRLMQACSWSAVPST